MQKVFAKKYIKSKTITYIGFYYYVCKSFRFGFRVKRHKSGLISISQVMLETKVKDYPPVPVNQYKDIIEYCKLNLAD